LEFIFVTLHGLSIAHPRRVSTACNRFEKLRRIRRKRLTGCEAVFLCADRRLASQPPLYLNLAFHRTHPSTTVSCFTALQTSRNRDCSSNVIAPAEFGAQIILDVTAASSIS
jgi:hypothetical protein